MRAARYNSYGPPEVLEIVDVPDPVPQADEVLVRLRAAGLNPADYKVRRGATPVAPLPSGIGRELAGTVVAVGADVRSVEVGDDVIGTGEHVIGELATLPQALVAPRPAAVPWAVAASIPVAAQTAYRATESLALTPADTVLVSAAAGGVGVIAAQLAVRTGARVIGTASERNHALLRSLGVEPVCYGSGLADRLRAAVPGGLTGVLDHHGPETIEAALELGVPRERINTISGYDTRYAVRYVARRGLERDLVARICDDLVSGALVIPIVAEFAFDDIVDAYRHLESGRAAGKVALTF